MNRPDPHLTERYLPPALLAEIASQCERRVSSELDMLVDAVTRLHGDTVAGILLYGSCLRSRNYREGVIDLYVLVNSYDDAYQKKSLARLNRLLPPNVFYIEAGEGEEKIRAKYAVISVEDTQRGVEHWFHSYLWSRFAQPVRLIHSACPATRLRIYYMLATAVLVFLRRTLPALGPGVHDTEALWIHGLSLTYAAELRPEQQDRARYITHQTLGDFIRLTQASAPALTDLLNPLPHGYYQIHTTPALRQRTLRLWRLRRWQGRLLSILRLMKAVYTFKDCVDYAAWKIRRHTGISIPVTPRMQRHPILYGFNVLWQLLRRDALN